jgi:ATP-binding cassette, subfamily F, member 3
MLLGRGPNADSALSEDEDSRRAKTPAKPSTPSKPAASKTSAKKRRFPYRKLADIEDEIFQRETSLEELQREMLQPHVLRDGNRVRQIKQQIDREQAAIKLLYEHWEEAAELNW